MSATVELTYLGDRFVLAEDGDGEMLRRIAARVAPFIAEDGSGELAATLHAEHVDGGALLERALREGEGVSVDASLYPTNTLGRRLATDRGWVVAIEATRTLCTFEPWSATIRVANADPEALELDTGRLLKALVTTGCERRGYVVVHASGAVTADGAVLFPADSRNGKTTMLLEALTRFDTRMLSCDTSVLRAADGRLVARGWPSNFSLSVGTLHDYSELQPLMEEAQRDLTYADAWSIHPKHVLDTHDVVAEMGVEIVPEAEVSAIVSLHLARDEAARVEPIDRSELRAELARVCLGSRDPLYPNWHGWWTVDEPAIERNLDRVAAAASASAEARRMTWAPGPETLLRRVGPLERASHNRPSRLEAHARS